jgi:hypothetical protein
VWLFGVVLVKPLLVVAMVAVLLHCAYVYHDGLRAMGLARDGDAPEYVAIAVVLLFAASTLVGGLLGTLGVL